jgi:VIT1/CCC1 family predicted Fe2+/Mn2+ transporter
VTAVLVPRRHRETHKSGRTSWLRAAVLGSNDAIVSVSSLMIGVGAADASKQTTLVAGVAGLVAGAMSMAVGEFVSVSAQRDSEQADIARESEELATSPEAELQELAAIYHHRGLDKDLAMEVAKQLSEHDRLGAHVRDELGIDARTRARPFQAAWISAVGFATFAMLPILGLVIAPASLRLVAIAAVTLVSRRRSGCLAAPARGPRRALRAPAAPSYEGSPRAGRLLACGSRVRPLSRIAHESFDALSVPFHTGGGAPVINGDWSPSWSRSWSRSWS